MSGELTGSSAEGADPSSSPTAAPPPDAAPSTSRDQSTDSINLSTISSATQQRQACPSQVKSRKILSDGDLDSIIKMISKLEPSPADGGQQKDAVDNTKTAPPPVELDSTCTRHQKGKTARGAGIADGENPNESPMIANPDLKSQRDTHLTTTSTPQRPSRPKDAAQPDFSKSIDFAQIQKADLIITIGGITALVVSSVVCHFSPLLRYMCTSEAAKPVVPVPGLEWEKYEYSPPRGCTTEPGIPNLPILRISSQECWSKDKGETVTITLHAMHGNSAELPLELLDLSLMGRIADFAWTYSCQRVMTPWFRIWLDRPAPIYQRLDQDIFSDHENSDLHLRTLGVLVTVAMVMRDTTALKSLWKMLLLLMPGDGGFVSQLRGCPTRILGQLEGPLLAKRLTVLSEVTSVLQHIYDLYVGKSKPHPAPGYLRILVSVTQPLGSCRHLQLAWFLCALEERLPSTGFLLADAKQTSLAEILASLYQVAGELESHHSQIANQGSNRELGKGHIFCEPLGRNLSRAIHLVQSGIDFPDCLLQNFVTPGDSRPLTPLVISSPLLKDVITRYSTLYREHIHQLHAGAKPSNNDWIFRWCAEWLIEMQGMAGEFDWHLCVPVIPPWQIRTLRSASPVPLQLPTVLDHQDFPLVFQTTVRITEESFEEKRVRDYGYRFSCFSRGGRGE
ncbi:hypothetical protein L211DRAFT_840231 [Terfezia boudieri ATCC MYA-4762]|uniref:Uncharacterized protein n=1 Tax=Terfezia boudieri ATCC MYA-4762 TaxID=1051890 RepID=A0A3N4LG69_9PEZI|nr:hypothetical protein L211DRAFT_840231 [Terfezia boudieri ATCC MYA-4762]